MELALFAISALLSAVSSVTVATLYVWPWLGTARPNQAFAMLVAPHLFLRFIGLSVLVPERSGSPAPRTTRASIRLRNRLHTIATRTSPGKCLPRLPGRTHMGGRGQHA